MKKDDQKAQLFKQPDVYSGSQISQYGTVQYPVQQPLTSLCFFYNNVLKGLMESQSQLMPSSHPSDTLRPSHM